MCKNKAGGESAQNTAPERSRSGAKLQAAVTRLLDERDPEQLTITDIVADAGVTRPTFYAVYGDLPSAFADAALSRLSGVLGDPTLGPDLPTDRLSADMGAALLSIVTRLEEHADFFSRILRGPGGHQVLAAIIDFIAERMQGHSPMSEALHTAPLPAAEAAAALAAGVTWITLEWLDETPRRPAAQFADHIRDFMLHSVFGGLGESAIRGALGGAA